MHSHNKPSTGVQPIQVSIVTPNQPPAHHSPSASNGENHLHHTENDDDDEEEDDDDDDEVDAQEVGNGHAHGGHHQNPLAGQLHRPGRRPHRVGLKPLKHKYGRDLGGGLSFGACFVLFSLSRNFLTKCIFLLRESETRIWVSF